MFVLSSVNDLEENINANQHFSSAVLFSSFAVHIYICCKEGNIRITYLSLIYKVQPCSKHKYASAQSCQMEVELGMAFDKDSFNIVKQKSSANVYHEQLHVCELISQLIPHYITYCSIMSSQHPIPNKYRNKASIYRPLNANNTPTFATTIPSTS